MKKPINANFAFISLILVLFLGTVTAEAQKKKNISFKNVSYGPAVNVMRTVSPAGVNSAGNHYVVVSLTINKGDLKGKAVLEDDMSVGLAASEITSGTAKFSFKKGVVTFTWKKLPDDKTITITYQLETFTSVPDKMTLTGEFDAGDRSVLIPATDFTMNTTPKKDSVKKVVAITPTPATMEVKPDSVKTMPISAPIISAHTDSTIAAISKTLPDNDVPRTSSKKGSQHPAKSSASHHQKPKHADSTAEAPVIYPVCMVPPPVIDETKYDNVKATMKDVAVEPVKTTEMPSQSQTDTPPKEANSSNADLYYRIQIGAFDNQSKLHSFLTRYKIKEKPVKETNDNATTRYLIGKFDDVAAAKNRVEELKGNGLDGAFVVPYYQDKRITFQEAAQLQNKKTDKGN